MRAVLVGIKTDTGNSLVYDPGILAGREVRATMEAAGKETALLIQRVVGHPGRDRSTGWFCQLKLDRPPGLLLDDHGTLSDSPAGNHITDPQSDQVATAQLAVDGQVEQGQITPFPCDLESHTCGPDLTGLQGWLLTHESRLGTGS